MHVQCTYNMYIEADATVSHGNILVERCTGIAEVMGSNPVQA